MARITRGLLVAWALSLSACISTHAPATPVAPLLDEAGDVVVAGSVRARPSQGANVYVAAAPTRNSRVFVSGTRTREVGEAGSDAEGRRMRERNRTDQLEGGAGYGFAYKHLVAEGLGGAGYGRTKAAQCSTTWLKESPEKCQLWVDSRSWFARGFVQLHAAAAFPYWQGGGGVRLTVQRYRFEELLGDDSKRVMWLPEVEPFIVQRLDLRIIKFELGLAFPLTMGSPEVESGRDTSFNDDGKDRLVRQPGPRVTLGVQLAFDEFFRGRLKPKRQTPSPVPSAPAPPVPSG